MNILNDKINKNTTDKEIVEFIKNDNKEYYSFLIDRYENKLSAYVKRLTYNSSETEDIIQQVFINVYINLNSFNINNKFSSWIYRIAHNLSINWLKKKKPSVFLDENENIANKLKNKINIERELINKENNELIIKVINKLPNKFKEPFILKYFEDKSYKEIAYILRIPKNTVGTFIARAKKFLQKELKKQTYDK